MSSAATRVRRKRGRSASVIVNQTPRVNMWPTPFVPTRERHLRQPRARSEPRGAESARRQAAADASTINSEWQARWNATFQQVLLEEEVPPLDYFDMPPVMDCPLPQSPVCPAHGEAVEHYVDTTDGESVDNPWGFDHWAAVVQTVTREMGPGTRRDMLDNHDNRWSYSLREHPATVTPQGLVVERWSLVELYLSQRLWFRRRRDQATGINELARVQRELNTNERLLRRAGARYREACAELEMEAREIPSL
ncbi:hypothetical protein DFH09DRAFT_1078661 [Mycena vulgaris]|nr:hypothetical protein DFH09DRAFT_1078661 [Mycena vulgaris]